MQTENRERVKAQRKERRMVRNVLRNWQRQMAEGGPWTELGKETVGGGGGGGEAPADGGSGSKKLSGLLRRSMSKGVQDASAPGASPPPCPEMLGTDAPPILDKEKEPHDPGAGNDGGTAEAQKGQPQAPSDSAGSSPRPQSQQKRQGSKSTDRSPSKESQGKTKEKEEEETEAEEDEEEDTEMTSDMGASLQQLREAFHEEIQKAQRRSWELQEEEQKHRAELRAELNQVLATGSRLESQGQELAWTVDRLATSLTAELRSLHSLAANPKIPVLSVGMDALGAGGSIPLDEEQEPATSPLPDHLSVPTTTEETPIDYRAPRGGDFPDPAVVGSGPAAQDAPPPRLPQAQPPPAARWIVEELQKDVRKVEDRHRCLEKDTRRLMAAFRELARPGAAAQMAAPPPAQYAWTPQALFPQPPGPGIMVGHGGLYAPADRQAMNPIQLERPQSRSGDFEGREVSSRRSPSGGRAARSSRSPGRSSSRGPPY